ncbi:DNA oxidative demethylase ALKBH2-like [Rhodnius prolixus]|uniref:DNA oxidative demethylase ALKBH2 n=1 Tax=Rhodnius prolixus TaxID=13249 RepID=R4G3E4_RHOPR
MSAEREIRWVDFTGEQLQMRYSPNFLKKEVADKLFDTLENEVQYFSGDLTKIRVFGKWRDIPRQQVAFGDPGLSYKFSGLTLPALSWPQFLSDLRDTVSNLLGYYYNFVLINRYRNGNDHIGEHRDDESELDVEAGIASVSLGQVRDFVMRHTDHRNRLRKVEPVKVALDHGSLLHMQPPTNKFWFHSLPVRKSANGVRINLTFRKVNEISIE